MLIDDGVLERDERRLGCRPATLDVGRGPADDPGAARRPARPLAATSEPVIERAAVEGKVFHRGARRRALANRGAPRAVGAHLDSRPQGAGPSGRRRQSPGEDAFRFRHLLIRDAAYDALPKELRAELHERFADWLAQAAGKRLVEYEEILGYHLEQAHDYRAELAPVDDAVRELGSAPRIISRLPGEGRWCVETGRLRETFSARAIALLPPTDDRLPGLLVEVGAALQEQGEFDEADNAFTRAAATAKLSGNRMLELRAELETRRSPDTAQPRE